MAEKVKIWFDLTPRHDDEHGFSSLHCLTPDGFYRFALIP